MLVKNADTYGQSHTTSLAARERSSITLLREKSKLKSETQTLLGIWALISHTKPETLILA